MRTFSKGQVLHGNVCVIAQQLKMDKHDMHISRACHDLESVRHIKETAHHKTFSVPTCYGV